MNPIPSYAFTLGSVVAWLSAPVSTALAVLLVLAAAWHALLGLQVVIEDYVADKGSRAAILFAVKFAVSG